MPELFSILWHPEGNPVEVYGVRLNQFPYAKTEAGNWWRLSEESVRGWRVPSVKVCNLEQIGRLEQIHKDHS